MRVQKLEDYAGPEIIGPAHEGDAGIDLYSAEYVSIPPGEWKLVRCGVRIALPAGTEGQVRPKSGLALKQGMIVLNAPGTIDEGYRGELMVSVWNANPSFTKEEIAELATLSNSFGVEGHVTSKQFGAIAQRWIEQTLTIRPGHKLAQLVITKYERPEIEYVNDLDETTRGDGGFGSTGYAHG